MLPYQQVTITYTRGPPKDEKDDRSRWNKDGVPMGELTRVISPNFEAMLNRKMLKPDPTRTYLEKATDTLEACVRRHYPDYLEFTINLSCSILTRNSMDLNCSEATQE